MKASEVQNGYRLVDEGMLNPTGIIRSVEIWEDGSAMVTLYSDTVPMGLDTQVHFAADDDIPARLALSYLREEQ